MLERYDALLGDNSAFQSETPYLVPSSATLATPVHKFFVYDKYVWDGFSADYAVLKLTKGYFVIVDFEDLEKVGQLKYLRAQVDVDQYSGEVRVRAKADDANGKPWLLHRYLMDAKRGQYIEHFNHWPLDCRRSRNLINTSQSKNIANARRVAKSGLSRGVYHPNGDTSKFRAQIRCGGEKFESPSYDTEDEAHQWYVGKHRELHGYTDDAGEVRTRNYPIFPPEKKLIIAAPSRKVRGSSRHKVIDEIPF